MPPFDTNTGLLRAGWPVTDTVAVGPTWVSGYYVAKLLLTTGPAAGKTSTVPVIVREGAARASAILVNASVYTWQAYNSWGGRSLYTFRDGHGSNHVSFKNAEADRIMVEYRKEFDKQRRIELYRRLQEIILDEAPYTFLFMPKSISTVDRRFHNTIWYPTGQPNVNEWWVPPVEQKYGH